MIREAKEVDLNRPETTLRHREIILQKPFLRKLYEEWYRSFVYELTKLPEGPVLEIGSGGGFLRNIYANVITSDILHLPVCDLTCSAEAIPLTGNSIRACFMLNVLHHIPHVDRFFSEVQRLLLPGGILFMIEPANTPFSRFIYQNLHHEPFLPDVKEWSFQSTGPLSGANGALPWIIFKRDLDRFHDRFPQLRMTTFRFHTPLRYLLTGGLSFKSVVPGWSFDMVAFLEGLLKPLFPALAMFQTINVTKLTPGN